MKLAEYRKEVEQTLDQLAREWGVPLTTLANWEAGHRTPRLETALKIKRWTDGKVTPEDFAAERSETV